MRHTLTFFLSLYVASIKPMELEPNNFQNDLPVDVIGNIACQIAVRNDGLRIKDLRSFSCVNKSWNSAMSKYAGLIIAAIASTLPVGKNPNMLGPFSFFSSLEIAKVAAAIKLGTAGSQKWLTEQYNDEEQCKALLFNLVKPLETANLFYSLSMYDFKDTLLIHSLQNVSGTLKEVSNKYSEELIKPVKAYLSNSPASGACFLLKFSHVIVGTDEAMLQEFNHEMLWKALARYSPIGDLLKKILLKRMIAYNPHDFLNRDKYDYLIGQLHRTWCWAMENMDWDYLQEIAKYSDHMENCDVCKCTPLARAFNRSYFDHWSDLLIALLRGNNITGNELYNGGPLIMVAIGVGEKNLTITLVKKPSCDINVQSSVYNNRTPLMAAIKDKWFDIAELLLERPDIDLNKKDRNGHTAYELAVNLGHDEIAHKIHEAQLRTDSQMQI